MVKTRELLIGETERVSLEVSMLMLVCILYCVKTMVTNPLIGEISLRRASLV